MYEKSSKDSRYAARKLRAELNKMIRVICIIRGITQVDHIKVAQYFATLRKARLYSGKLQCDDARKQPDYTWCFDTECAPTVPAAKQLARDYAKKLGMRIARFDERL